MHIIDLPTNTRISLAQANRLPRIKNKTQITDKTCDEAMANNMLAWEQPTEKPGDDYLLGEPHAVDGVYSEIWVQKPAAPAEEITALKVSATQQVNSHFEQKTRTLLNAWYPDFEQLTWPQQEADARAFLADPQADTPYIDKLLPDPAEDQTVYDTARSALCTRIVANADSYRDAALKQAKPLQAHRASIWAATDKAGIDTALQAALA